MAVANHDNTAVVVAPVAMLGPVLVATMVEPCKPANLSESENGVDDVVDANKESKTAGDETDSKARAGVDVVDDYDVEMVVRDENESAGDDDRDDASTAVAVVVQTCDHHWSMRGLEKEVVVVDDSNDEDCGGERTSMGWEVVAEEGLNLVVGNAPAKVSPAHSVVEVEAEVLGVGLPLRPQPQSMQMKGR